MDMNEGHNQIWNKFQQQIYFAETYNCDSPFSFRMSDSHPSYQDLQVFKD